MLELPASPPPLLRILIINVVISGTVGRVHVDCECTGPSNAVAMTHKSSTEFMTVSIRVLLCRGVRQANLF